MGKGRGRRLGGCRVSQVEGNPERRGCLAIRTRNSQHPVWRSYTSGMWCEPPAGRFSYKWMSIPARVEIQMRD